MMNLSANWGRNEFTVMLVADGKPTVNFVLRGASRGVLVIQEEPHNAVGAADGDVIPVEIGSPHRAGENLAN